MRNVMVTGGCGFMGSHFVEMLLENDVQNVVVVDKLSYAGNLRSIEKVKDNPFCKFYLSDIAHPEIAHIMRWEKIDTVINFAAETHVDRSITHPKAFLETDILGLFNLAYWSMKNQVKTFLQISTDEVYGSIPGCEEANEKHPLNPTSPYSASKAAAELLLQSYHKTYGLPLIIVRCCNNFGPRQYPEKLIPMAITRLLNDKSVLLHGDGREIREWIYVEDCVERILGALQDGKIGEIYNIGSNLRLDNFRVVLSILGILKKKKIDIKYVENRPNNDFRYAINCDRFKLEIHPYSDGNWDQFDHQLTDTVKWYHENPDWWEGEVDLDSNLYKKGESLK